MNQRLTNKQKAFVEAYLENGMNGTQAVYKAGYRAKDDCSAAAIASENLRKLKIKQIIEQRLKDMAMSADEVLYRLSRQAEGVDPTEFMSLEPVYEIDDAGISYLNGYILKINLDEIRERGLGNLIKRMSQTSSGISVEWYSTKEALEILGKYHRLFTERVEHSGPEGGPIPIKEVIVELPKDE